MGEKLKEPEFFSKDFTDRVVPAFWANKLSIRTKKEYYRNVINICNFFQKDFLDITKEDAQTYFEHLKSCDMPANNKTLRVKKASLITMEKCALRSEWSTESSIYYNIEFDKTNDDINADKTPTEEDIKKLLSASANDPDIHMIFLLLSRMGLTASQIMRLKKEQFRMDEDELYISFSKKNHTEHLMAVPYDIMDELLDYLHSIQTEYLFTNRNRRPLKWAALCRIMQKYRILANVSTKCTAKDIRNRVLLEQLQSGATKEEVMKYTGISQKRVTVLEQNVPKLRICPPEKLAAENR